MDPRNLNEAQVRASLISLAARDQRRRKGGSPATEEPAGTFNQEAGFEPQVLFEDNSGSPTGWKSVTVTPAGASEAYLLIDGVANADSDKFVMLIRDGNVEVEVMVMGTSDNDADSNPLKAFYWSQITNGGIEFNADVTNGAPLIRISLIRTR